MEGKSANFHDRILLASLERRETGMFQLEALALLVRCGWSWPGCGPSWPHCHKANRPQTAVASVAIAVLTGLWSSFFRPASPRQPCVFWRRPRLQSARRGLARAWRSLADSGAEDAEREERRQRVPVADAQLAPLEVHFSQMRANPHFRDGRSLVEAIEQIKHVPFEGTADRDDMPVWLLKAPFPPIEVLKWRCKLRDETGKPLIDAETGDELIDAEDRWFTLDNRRLYCLQKAAVALWPERAVAEVARLPSTSLTKLRQLKKFRTLDRGCSILIGNRVGGPMIGRWSWRESVGLEATSLEVPTTVQMRRRPRRKYEEEQLRARTRQHTGRRPNAEIVSEGEVKESTSSAVPWTGIFTFLLLYIAIRCISQAVVFLTQTSSSSDASAQLPGELEPEARAEDIGGHEGAAHCHEPSRRPRANTDGLAPRRLRDTRARRSVACAPFEVSSLLLRRVPAAVPDGKKPCAVTLRIYDVTGTEVISGLNRLCRAIGTGAFHAGVEVYGAEWSFGYTDDGGSGIFSCAAGLYQCDPGECGEHTYREAEGVAKTAIVEAVAMGATCLREEDWKCGVPAR
eukprot:s7610_g2.t3